MILDLTTNASSSSHCCCSWSFVKIESSKEQAFCVLRVNKNKSVTFLNKSSGLSMMLKHQTGSLFTHSMADLWVPVACILRIEATLQQWARRPLTVWGSSEVKKNQFEELPKSYFEFSGSVWHQCQLSIKRNLDIYWSAAVLLAWKANTGWVTQHVNYLSPLNWLHNHSPVF